MINAATLVHSGRMLGKTISHAAVKHLPEILTVIGVGMNIAATITAVVEAPKAKAEMTELSNDPDLDHKEYNRRWLRCAFYHYWPTVALSICGTAFIFGAQKVSIARTAAALAALQLKSDDLEKLKKKISDMDGEQHFQAIKNELAKDEVITHPINMSTVVNTGHGNMLFYEPIGGGYYLSDLEFIRKMRDEANDELSDAKAFGRKAVISLNSWFDYIGFKPLDGKAGPNGKVAPSIGNDIGWVNRKIDLDITVMKLEDDTIVHVLGYKNGGEPRWCKDIGDMYWDFQDDETDMADRC